MSSDAIVLVCVLARDLRSTNIYLRSNTGTIKIGCVEKGYLMRFAHPSVLSGRRIASLSIRCVLHSSSSCSSIAMM